MNPLNESLKQQVSYSKDSDNEADISDKTYKNNIWFKKKKFIISISLILAIINLSFISILLFKFCLSKKNDEDIYSLPISIIREENQVTYFTERKTIKSEISYTSRRKEEILQLINTDFMAILTDSIEDKKENTTINYASLIILDSKGKIHENETKLNSFNIFDELILNEFESSPNGTKYPMGQFSFFKNGTIAEIKLPNDMDKYNAQVIIELINNIVVKIVRNKKEEETEVKLKNINSNHDILSETLSPREYKDKFTNIKYSGSTLSKSIERDIENERIKNINVNTKLNLKTQKEENEVLDFGLDNYIVDIKSEISALSYEEEQKELSQLVKRLSEKLQFINSEDLMKSIISKEQEEIKKDQENHNSEESESKFEEENYSSNNLRNLLWSGGFFYKIDFIKTNILGQSVEIFYEIGLDDGEIKNELCLDTSLITIKLGNPGVFSNKNQKKKKLGTIPLFTIPFPGCPIPISFNFEINGELGFSVAYDEDLRDFSISLTGELSANAEVEVGIKYIFSVSVGANGVIIGVTATSKINTDSYIDGKTPIIPTHSIEIYGGQISLFVRAKLFIWQIFYIGINIFNGWSKKITLY